MTKYKIIDIEDVSNPLMNLSSTPVAILSHIGLKTYIGISGDDPSGIRNIGENFQLLLSIYQDSSLFCVVDLGLIGPGQRQFVSVDHVLEALNIDVFNIPLVVIHRVPSQYFNKGKLSKLDEGANVGDYYMYRVVVQYENALKGMASVTYETPPKMNYLNNGKASFLSFSNMLVKNEDSENILVFINYSMNFKYDKTCSLYLNFYNENGIAFKSNFELVKPFSILIFKVGDLLKNEQDGDRFSYVAASRDAILLPLSLIINLKNGGMSLEHTHPPQEYLYADWLTGNAIKSKAVEYYSKDHAL